MGKEQMQKGSVQLFSWLHLYFPKHKFSNSFTCFQWKRKEWHSVNHSSFILTIIETPQTSQRNWPSASVIKSLLSKHSLAFPSDILWFKITAFHGMVSVWFCIWSWGKTFVSNCTLMTNMLNNSQPGSQQIQKSTINMSQGGNKHKTNL